MSTLNPSSVALVSARDADPFAQAQMAAAVNRPGFHDCSGYWVAASPAGSI